MARPIKSFKCGTVVAAIFENQTAKGTMRKTTLSKRYKTAEGEWKSTSSLDVNDLPKASLALDKAYEFLVMGGETGEGMEGFDEGD